MGACVGVGASEDACGCAGVRESVGGIQMWGNVCSLGASGVFFALTVVRYSLTTLRDGATHTLNVRPPHLVTGLLLTTSPPSPPLPPQTPRPPTRARTRSRTHTRTHTHAHTHTHNTQTLNMEQPLKYGHFSASEAGKVPQLASGNTVPGCRSTLTTLCACAHMRACAWEGACGCAGVW